MYYFRHFAILFFLLSGLSVYAQISSENRPLQLQYTEAAKVFAQIDQSGNYTDELSDCPDCPKYPVNGDSYWDKQGRNWVYADDRWNDLSWEFCAGEDCNDEWKKGVDVSSSHKSLYEDKLRMYENTPGQLITDEFKQHLWRETQFATVHILKNKWVAEQVGNSWWNILIGNIKRTYYLTKVANGDKTFYADITLSSAFSVADIFIVKDAVKTVIYVGNKAYYIISKNVVTWQLAYRLSKASPDAIALFNKQIDPVLEIIDKASNRYIRFDPATGETLVTKFADSGDRELLYEGMGTIEVSQGLSQGKQVETILKEVNVILGKISSVDELKVYLSNITESTTVAQLEEKGIKVFFRGTTRSIDGILYPGNPNTIENGISTSTDPVRATIFAIESATDNGAFKGIVEIAIPSDLKNIKLLAPNRRVDKELEIVFNTSADNFSQLSKIEISVEDSRKLVKEIYGIDLPSRISSRDVENARYLTEVLPKSSLEKSYEFYQKVIQYSKK